MFTAFSADTRRSDLTEQKHLHQEQLRTRLRRLRRRVRHAASVQREKALIYRLLAGRFPLYLRMTYFCACWREARCTA